MARGMASGRRTAGTGGAAGAGCAGLASGLMLASLARMPAISWAVVSVTAAAAAWPPSRASGGMSGMLQSRRGRRA